MAEAFALGATETKLRNIIHNRERDIAGCWIAAIGIAQIDQDAGNLLIAGVLYRDFTRGKDDATVVVAKAV